MYLYTNQITLNKCHSAILYRVISYLIINNSNITDEGKYVLEIFSTYTIGIETVLQEVSVIIGE